MFSTAQATPVKTTKAAGSLVNAVPLAGLCQLAEIDAVIKALLAAKTTIEAGVKSDAFDHFFDQAQKIASRPENFRGVDGYASASIEMRKRSTASALSAEEIEMFQAQKLVIEKVVSVQKYFVINQTYANDMGLLGKVEAALKGIVPTDFIQVQEEKSKYVVGDATITAAFAQKAPRHIIEAITTMAIKPLLINTDIKEIFKNVKTLLIGPETH